MYKILLIVRYLRRKLAPMFAALAVTLCTAMVVIVISVMGGFLEMLQSSARRLTGDVIITAHTMTGFAHYDELIEGLVSRPEIEAATPVMRAYGLLQIAGRTIPVQIIGIRPESLDRVVGYKGTLYWSQQDIWTGSDGWDIEHYAMTLQVPGGVGEDPKPAIVIGIEVNPFHRRDDEGRYNAKNAMVGVRSTLTVLPITRAGAISEPRVKPVVVVNEFKSGMLEVDANQVYVDFEVLQRLLRLHEVERIDMETGEPTGQINPATASEIALRGAPGYGLAQVQEAAADATVSVTDEYPDMPIPSVLTWEQRHGTLIGAVKNEKGLITFLFVIISVVAFVMVATTFYNIVLEKTRDIGLLRAIGASKGGILNIFLGYGLAIGIIGSIAGVVLAVVIVTNLNEIQDLLDAWFGWRMWDPKLYFFDRIPGRIDPVETVSIVVGAILSSVAGSLIPAILAARLNPIEALRYE